jgi:hypothetical protein
MAIDAALGRLGIRPGVCTSSTRPANPFEGQVIYETDTNNIRFWSGSAWESNKGGIIYYDDGSSQQWVEFGAPPVQHGKILQVVSTTVTNTFSASLAAGADTAITGLSATITPNDTANKILIMVDVHMSDQSDDYGRGAIRIYRGATSIGEGGLSSPRTSVFASSIVLNANGINIMNIAGTYLDSPSTTSATTYAVHAVNAWPSTKTIRNNRGGAEPTDESATRPSSTITLLEVSA